MNIGGVGGVASYYLHAVGHSRRAAAVDYPDSPRTPLDQRVHHRHPHSPGAEVDVKLAVVGHLCLSSALWLLAPVPRPRLAGP
jgi:hypothetical protein